MDTSLLDYGTRVLRQAAWAPLTVLVVHAVAASLLGHPRNLDPLMHFAGGAAVAYFFFCACYISHRYVGALPQLATFVLVFTGTCTIALFWEFGEYLSDAFLGTRVQASLAETMSDLLFGTAGAVVYLLSSLFMARRAPHTELGVRESESEVREPV
jgi:hypothetical protein